MTESIVYGIGISDERRCETTYLRVQLDQREMKELVLREIGSVRTNRPEEEYISAHESERARSEES